MVGATISRQREYRTSFKNQCKSFYFFIHLKDTYTIFSNPTYASLNYWMLKGEQATWPVLANLKSRLKVEFALDEAMNKLKAKLAKESLERRQKELQMPSKLDSKVDKMKRTKSIH